MHDHKNSNIVIINIVDKRHLHIAIHIKPSIECIKI